MKLTGKISVFGGPKDTGMSPAEGLALVDPRDLNDPRFIHLFLDSQPPDTTGLGRRLNPDALYIACRWDYKVTSRDALRDSTVAVSANGRNVIVKPVDWGPNEATGRIADLSPGAAAALGLQTDDEATVELLLGQCPKADPGAAPAPAAPSSLVIDQNHWLVGARIVPIVGGKAMPVRRCVVNHFTGGATAASSIDALKQRGLSVHFTVDRDGAIYQSVPCNQVAWHAGVSRWVDPHTGTRYDGVNNFGVGIEIANAGDDTGALSWARKQPGFQSKRAVHRNGGPEEEWECYPDAQIAAVTALNQALVARYHLDDVTGHDCIAPERKNDPGPLFPMAEIRAACGFSGLPVVNRQ